MSRQFLYSALGVFSPRDELAVSVRFHFLHELGSSKGYLLGIGDRELIWKLYTSALFGDTLSYSHSGSYVILFEDRIYAAGGHCYAMIDKKWLEVTRLSKSKLSVAGGWLVVSAEKLGAGEVRRLEKLVVENPVPELAAKLIGEEERIPVALAAIRSRVTVNWLRGSRAMWCATDRGRVRKNNEDGVLCLSLRASEEGLSSKYRLLAVADGAGGHGHGEIASRETLQEVAYRTGEAVILGGSLERVEQVQGIVSLANERVLHAKQVRRSNMASTLTMILSADEDLFIAHVGDSRAYYINQDNIEQLTEDHKYVEELVKKGVITRQQARVHPQRNIITSALGMPQPRVDVAHYPRFYVPGARLLVCSDGLSDLLEDWEIHQIAMRTIAPNQAASQLVKAANRKGGHDNISVALDFFL
ncbi:MAG: protein phosphatase 2C domain-containing protein [Thermofilaceae archaeon]